MKPAAAKRKAEAPKHFAQDHFVQATDEDPANQRDAIDGFLASSPKTILNLQHTITLDDADGLKILAHKSRISTSLFGAPDIVKKLEGIIAAAAKNDLPAATTVLNEMIPMLQDLLAELTAFRKTIK